PKGDPVYVYQAVDERQEAAFVANVIELLHRQGRSYGDFTLLYRTHAQKSSSSSTGRGGATATSPFSTGPTPSPGPSRRSSSGGGCPTRSSRACAFTTGKRSKTCWPTCG